MLRIFPLLLYKMNFKMWIGLQSIKYVTLFWTNFDPPPSVTRCHTSWNPPKARHTSRNPSIHTRIFSSRPTCIHTHVFTGRFVLVRGVLVWGVMSGFFCLEGFVRGGFCPF